MIGAAQRGLAVACAFAFTAAPRTGAQRRRPITLRSGGVEPQLGPSSSARERPGGARDNGLDNGAWAGVRQQCATSVSARSTGQGSGAVEVRRCRCGTLERNVEDIHALIRSTALTVPSSSSATRQASTLSSTHVIRVGCRRARARRLAQRIRPPPLGLAVGRRLGLQLGPTSCARGRDLGACRRILAGATRAVCDRGGRAQLDTDAARARPETRRTRSESSRSTADDVIQDDQPGLVAAAIDEAASSFPEKKRLRCTPAFAANHGLGLMNGAQAAQVRLRSSSGRSRSARRDCSFRSPAAPSRRTHSGGTRRSQDACVHPPRASDARHRPGTRRSSGPSLAPIGTHSGSCDPRSRVHGLSRWSTSAEPSRRGSARSRCSRRSRPRPCRS